MTDIQAAIARMQSNRKSRPEIWENPNGTFSHNRDGNTEWRDLDACKTDLRFHKEWAA